MSFRYITEGMSAAGAWPFSSVVLHLLALSVVFSHMQLEKWTALADARVGNGEYACLHLTHAPLEWRDHRIFILEGILTVAISLVAYFIVPTWSHKAKFVSASFWKDETILQRPNFVYVHSLLKQRESASSSA